MPAVKIVTTPAGVIRPTASMAVRVNHKFLSGPTVSPAAIAPGGTPVENVWMAPVAGLIRPTPLRSVNHTLPSGPLTIWSGCAPAGNPARYSVMVTVCAAAADDSSAPILGTAMAATATDSAVNTRKTLDPPSVTGVNVATGTPRVHWCRPG